MLEGKLDDAIYFNKKYKPTKKGYERLKKDFKLGSKDDTFTEFFYTYKVFLLKPRKWLNDLIELNLSELQEKYKGVFNEKASAEIECLKWLSLNCTHRLKQGLYEYKRLTAFKDYEKFILKYYIYIHYESLNKDLFTVKTIVESV
jgi:hypothetical protein